MHRCLVVRELLTSIFEFHDRKRELSVLARTCRAFADPALDILWRELACLSTLIKATVPSHLWEDVSPRGLSEIVTLFFRGPPAPSDLNRFAYYASRVRSLGTNEAGREGAGEKIDPSVFHYLHEYQPTSPILPRLRHLVWNILNPNALSSVDHFLGPNILYLQLSVFAHHSQQDIMFTFDRIQHKCVNLEEIHMADRTKSPVIAEARSRFMGSLANLRVLSLTLGCRTLGYRAMIHFSNLQLLEKLTLTIRALSPTTVKDANWHQTYAIPETPFPRLQVLSIETAAMDFCFALLSLVQESPLQTMHLDYDPYDVMPTPDYPADGPALGDRAFKRLRFLDVSVPELAGCIALFRPLHLTALEKLDVRIAVPAEDDLERFVVVCSQCCSPSTLTFLRLSQRSAFVGNLCHPSGVILPILPFSRLTDLIMLPGGHVEVDDSLADDMASAWPELECIAIGASDHTKGRGRITLGGLVPFARHCRKLRCVRLAIDLHGALPQLPSLTVELDGLGNPSVRELWFGLCPMPPDKVEEVAKFLKSLFPMLELLHAYHSGGCGQRSRALGGSDEVCPWSIVRAEVLST